MNTSTVAKASSRSIWLALISVYIVWGSTYLAIRFGVQTIPPFLMAGTRFLVAGGALYLFRRLRGDPAPTLRQWGSAAVVGLAMLTVGNGLVSWAEQRVDSGIAALLVGTVPLWMVVIDALRPKVRRPGHPLHWPAVLGIVVGFTGIVLLVSPSSVTGLGGDIDLVGGGALVVGALSWAAGSLYSRTADLPDSPLVGTSLEMLCGGVGLYLVGSITGEWGQLNLAGITWQSLAGLAYLIVFGSWVGFASYTWLLRNAPTSLVSTYAYVNPMVAIIIGNLLAQEPFTPRVVIAAVVIIGAVVIITLAQPARAKAPAPETETTG
jgi:drug/metabolite transporter (DMT)-like permease